MIYGTLQFHWGGLFDARPADHRIHLSTTGLTLCGLDLFAEGVPGWSRNGGISDGEAAPCPACLAKLDPEDRVSRRTFFLSVFPPELLAPATKKA